MNTENETLALPETAQFSEESYFDVVLEAATVGDMLSAKRHLAQLYSSGTGVQQNKAEAVRWYSLSALQAMNELDTAPSPARADGAYNILLELGELHYELGDTQRAINTFLRMETMLDSLPEELRSPQTVRWLQICSNKLGSLYERTANPKSAYNHFSRALEIAAAAAESDDSEIAQDDLAVASYRVGFMDYLFRGERSELDRAYDIWSSLYEQTEKYDYRRKKGVIDTLLATADTSEGPLLTLPSDRTEETPLPETEPEQIAPEGSDADALSAELSEYIREHGRSRSSTFERIRPVLDAILIIAAIALCVWGYFAGVFHEIFKFLR